MSTRRDFVEGDTAPEDATLYDGEGASRVAIDGTGLTVTLELRDRSESIVRTEGDVDWLVAAAGTVRYTPDAGDLKASGSPYAARWKVTDSGGGIASYPRDAAEEWTVRR